MKSNVKMAAKALGWFSLGLGASELLGGGWFGRAIGLRRGHGLLVRAFGAREIAAGIGLLAKPRDAKPWLWARVVGDAIDLAALGRAMVSSRNDRTRIGVAAGAVLGVTAADVAFAVRS